MQQTMDATTSAQPPARATDGAALPRRDAQMPEVALAARFREIGMLTRSLLEAEDALKREQAAHAATRAALEQAQYASQSYQEVISSTSWRITAPLRRMMTLLRR